MKINEKDEDNTTFSLYQGVYRFLRMLLGLKSTLSMFQRALYIIMSAGK